MTKWYVSYSWARGGRSGFGSIYFYTPRDYIDQDTLDEFHKQINEKNDGQNSVIISFNKIEN